MKVLVTGASGVLGWHLIHFFRQAGHQVFATCFRNEVALDGVTLLPLDLGSRLSVRRLCGQPWDAVIHAAALTSPDACQKDREHARKVNVEATAELVENLSPEAHLVYVSTDLVFDGEKGSYTEEDEVNPINFYAETKLEAEKLVAERPRSVVARVAKIVALGSPFHPCFLTWMQDRFERGERVSLFEDQYRTPISALDLGPCLAALLESNHHSLYHLGGATRLSRAEMGRDFAEIFGWDERLIDPVPMASVLKVPRGRDCSLDSDRFIQEFGVRPAAFREGLIALRNWGRELQTIE